MAKETVSKEKNGSGGAELSPMAKAFAEKKARMAPVSVEYNVWPIEVDGRPNPICGVLLRREERDTREAGGEIKKSTVYIIANTLPAVVKDPNSQEDGAVITIEPGGYVLLFERFGIRKLSEYLPTLYRDPATGRSSVVQASEVVIEPTRKIKLAGGKSMWRIEVHAATIAPSEAGVKLLAMPTTSASDRLLQAPAARELEDPAF